MPIITVPTCKGTSGRGSAAVVILGIGQAFSSIRAPGGVEEAVAEGPEASSDRVAGAVHVGGVQPVGDLVDLKNHRIMDW